MYILSDDYRIVNAYHTGKMKHNILYTFPFTEWKKANPVQPNSSNKFKTKIHIAVTSKTNLTLKLAQQRT